MGRGGGGGEFAEVSGGVVADVDGEEGFGAASVGGGGGGAAGHLDEGCGAALGSGALDTVVAIGEVDVAFEAGEFAEEDLAADRVEGAVEGDRAVDRR